MQCAQMNDAKEIQISYKKLIPSQLNEQDFNI